MGHFLLLILVGTGQGSSRLSGAMEQAVRLVLGTAGDVIVEERPSDFPDQEAVRAEERVQARAVARIDLAPAQSSRERLVEIRVHRAGRSAGADGWITRIVAFAPGTELSEIGRAAGYTILTMLPAGEVPAPRELRPQETARAMPEARAGPAAPELPTARAPRELAVDVMGAATTGLGGAGGGVGGVLRFGWRVWPAVAIGAGVLGRTGDLDAADVNARTFGLLLGAAIAPWSSPRFSLAVRIEAMAGLTVASRNAVNQPAASQWRWLPAGRATAEGAIRLAPRAFLLLAAGVEVGAGHTDVIVAGEKKAVLAAGLAIAEAGIRIRF